MLEFPILVSLELVHILFQNFTVGLCLLLLRLRSGDSLFDIRKSLLELLDIITKLNHVINQQLLRRQYREKTYPSSITPTDLLLQQRDLVNLNI